MVLKNWIMRQTWSDLLFAHWNVPLQTVRSVVPAQLEIDTYEGTAWMAIVPFLMTGIRGRFLPEIPTVSESLEFNLSTYVRYQGVPGVYFFSLDAAKWPIVWGGRGLYHLPYFHARMSLERSGGWVGYSSRRIHGGSWPAEFRGRYRPAGAPYRAAPGTLEHFLTERYALFTERDGRVSRGEIQHDPWPLQDAIAEFEMDTMAVPLGISLFGAPLLHFSKRVEVLIGPSRAV
jgi:uncharacterized protein YqjF (DUF2071 family)